MSVQQGPSPTYTPGDGPARSSYGGEPSHGAGSGWVMFAGTMLVIVGILNVIYGIAAIDDAHFYVAGANYVISDLNTWGWVLLITGGLQLLTGFGVWARNAAARWAGVGFACLNGIGVLLMLPAYPLLALSLFAVDVLIVYGLVVHGGHLEEA